MIKPVFEMLTLAAVWRVDLVSIVGGRSQASNNGFILVHLREDKGTT